MKKTIEFNSRFNIGTIVYGVLDGKIVKGKIINIEYKLEENFLKEPKKEINYGVCIFGDKRPFPKSTIDFYIDNNSIWFETITEVKNNLINQIKNKENEEND